MRRAAVVLAALTLAACSGPQHVLDPAGDQASLLHGLMGVMLVVCGLAYALVITFLIVAIWRGRRRRAASSSDNAPDDDRLRLGLIAWIGFIVVGLGVLTATSFLADRSLARDNSGGSAQVRITGHQWWWRVEVLEPTSGRWIETANELHLPVGQPTRIEVVSADVIHSFWIPNLSGKLDMIPGRVNSLALTPRRTGWLRGQCAEFCGLQHAQMALDVKVESPAEHAAWLSAQAAAAAVPSDDVAARGRDVFAGSPCAACHTVRGVSEVGRAGPDLTHVASRRFIGAGALPMSHATLMAWIAQPQDHKPGAQMPPAGLAPQDVEAVTRYLESLR